MAFKFIHPDFGHPEGIPADVGGEVFSVGLVGPLNVGNPGAGQDLHAPTTLPHLQNTQSHPSVPRPNMSTDESSSLHLLSPELLSTAPEGGY